MKKSISKTCRICGYKRLSYYDQFWQCSKCLYQFVDEYSSTALTDYYQRHIDLIAQNVLEDKGNKVKLRKYAKLALTYLTKLGGRKKICDIGCGTGLFLREVKKRGYDVYGYDISRSQSELAKKKKLDNVLYARSLKEYCRKKMINVNYFDVITCFEVIEHIPNVHEFLDEIYDYLKPNGILILSTPNSERIHIKEKWDYPPFHVSRFAKKNIQRLLKMHSFRIKNFLFFNELGYYSSNYIANFNLSKHILRHMVESTSKKSASKKNLLYVTLFRFLARMKKIICIFLDIPIIFYLSLFKRNKGHTMLVIAQKQ